MDNKDKWKAFNVEMPRELIPIYNELQKELSFLLSTKKYRKLLSKVNLDQARGKIWIEMHSHLSQRTNKLKINNKAWFQRILYENLRRELESKKNNILIYNHLKDNNFKIDETLWDTLENNDLKSSYGQLQNMKDSRTTPTLAYNATLNLDYTASAPQMFKMTRNLDGTYTCEYKIDKSGNVDEDWITQTIKLPYTLSGNLTGEIAKPRFVKRKKDGKYIGIISYSYTPEPKPATRNILGVDLGKINSYTATALYKDNSYSQSYINSRKIKHLQDKVDVLYGEKSKLWKKIEKAAPYNVITARQQQRLVDSTLITNKITRIKDEIARRSSTEIVEIAVKEGCSEIHLENLSWLKSKGGKWNFAATREYIIEKAEEYNISVRIVNAAFSSSEHPITYEKGKEVGREVVFNDGFRINRDNLASITIACRKPNKKAKPRVPNTLKKGKATPKRIKPKKHDRVQLKKKIKNIKKRTVQIVTAPVDQATKAIYHSTEAQLKHTINSQNNQKLAINDTT